MLQECLDGNAKCVQIRDYEAIFDELTDLSDHWDVVLMGKKWAYSGGASFAVYGLVSEDKKRLELSPIMLMKATKNKVQNWLSRYSNHRSTILWS
jgi:hypothetical protein